MSIFLAISCYHLIKSISTSKKMFFLCSCMSLRSSSLFNRLLDKLCVLLCALWSCSALENLKVLLVEFKVTLLEKRLEINWQFILRTIIVFLCLLFLKSFRSEVQISWLSLCHFDIQTLKWTRMVSRINRLSYMGIPVIESFSKTSSLI